MWRVLTRVPTGTQDGKPTLEPFFLTCWLNEQVSVPLSILNVITLAHSTGMGVCIRDEALNTDSCIPRNSSLDSVYNNAEPKDLIQYRWHVYVLLKMCLCLGKDDKMMLDTGMSTSAVIFSQLSKLLKICEQEPHKALHMPLHPDVVSVCWCRTVSLGSVHWDSPLEWHTLLTIHW